MFMNSAFHIIENPLTTHKSQRIFKLRHQWCLVLATVFPLPNLISGTWPIRPINKHLTTDEATLLSKEHSCCINQSLCLAGHEAFRMGRQDGLVLLVEQRLAVRECSFKAYVHGIEETVLDNAFSSQPCEASYP